MHQYVVFSFLRFCSVCPFSFCTVCTSVFVLCGFRQRPTEFKFCKSVHHRTIQINHHPDATIFQFIILTFIYSLTCFGRFPAHHQELNDCSGSLWFYLRIMVTVVLCSWFIRTCWFVSHNESSVHGHASFKIDKNTCLSRCRNNLTS